jgi:predicted acetyltransferase
VTDLRALETDELPAAIEAMELAFNSDSHPEDKALDRLVIDASRTLAAFEGTTPIATCGWFDLTMTLPGTVAPVAGVTWVSVSPGHRRRGLLRELMTRQLADLQDAGRPVAALWASEAAIYHRFGYGPASWHHTYEVRRGAAFTRPVATDGLRLVPPSQEVLAPVFDAVVASRPGYFARDAHWWTYRLHDPEHRRDGGSSLRCVVDGTEGYALFSTKAEWGPGGSAGMVRVRELVGATPDSEARLWRFLLDLDLTAKTTAWAQPVDSPLVHLLAEPRAALPRLGDGLWVRLVSLPEALQTRRYATEVDVVLEVSDDVCPWNAGRWRLSAGPSGAICAPTTDPADLTLDVRELGAAFLGGTLLTARARAGWVTEQAPGALAETSLAFTWPGPAPHCPMVF